jgi:hypothetical protein
MQFVAAPASMDEDPFAIAANGDRDRLHERAALRRPITRVVVVEVTAPQAARAVVPVRRSRRVCGDVQPATATSERAGHTEPIAMALVA